jgi:hypothetical protein
LVSKLPPTHQTAVVIQLLIVMHVMLLVHQVAVATVVRKMLVHGHVRMHLRHDANAAVVVPMLMVISSSGLCGERFVSRLTRSVVKLGQIAHIRIVDIVACNIGYWEQARRKI